MFKTIEANAQGLYIEKKSKFIANVFYVTSIEEAEELINSMKKQYHAARHNCYAYRILSKGTVVERQSDDGEPSGTAGAPMLNILNKKELVNVLVVVTRYFGGILLGTGGLVKAYSEALNQAIQNTKEVEKESGYLLEVTATYEKQRELEYICEKNKINIVSKEYKESIKNIIEISIEKYEKIFKENEKNENCKIKETKYINKTE
ncbi:MAG: YigZ family protein [Clostridia bacterium]|nr:YigZ family protein [Clostridia bacterium]